MMMIVVVMVVVDNPELRGIAVRVGSGSSSQSTSASPSQVMGYSTTGSVNASVRILCKWHGIRHCKVSKTES
jgi:hypothetical protein